MGSEERWCSIGGCRGHETQPADGFVCACVGVCVWACAVLCGILRGKGTQLCVSLSLCVC